jgi:hypothetical protein
MLSTIALSAPADGMRTATVQKRLHTGCSQGKVSVGIPSIIALQGFEHAVCFPNLCQLVDDTICNEIADRSDVGGGTFVGELWRGQFTIRDLKDLEWQQSTAISPSD